jgi:BirA family transcriptional regulator, biotin operon repressor / biotin---[acetyl-CoA-carboxylase] ligase
MIRKKDKAGARHTVPRFLRSFGRSPKKPEHYPGCLTVIPLKQCDSTNNYIKKNYSQLEKCLPVLVSAECQTAGRGRGDRTWNSTAGKGMYTSFGFYLENRQNLNLLPLIAGIAVIETIIRVGGPQMELKWPNDIVYKGKKVAGILIENIITEEHLSCITGIGVNLNHHTSDFSSELVHKATSLKLATDVGENYPVETTRKILAQFFFQWLSKLEDNCREEIIETVNRYCLQMKGKAISFHRSGDNKIIQGVFQGINRDGGLILDTEDKEDKTDKKTIFYSGEIGY